MTVPVQRPHKSNQNVHTPPDFLDAVREHFGPLILDAASDGPNVCSVWFGPGGVTPDGLTTPWPRGGWVWINPPFRDCKAWAQKCATESKRGVRSLLLTPLALETKWFESVENACRCLVLRPRLRFVGHEHDFPKGLMLSVFGNEERGIFPWRWRS